MNSEKFLEDLRAEVLAAAARMDDAAADQADPVITPSVEASTSRRGPRIRAGLLAAAAAIAVVVTLGAVLSSSPSRAAADVEVIRQGDDLVIKLTDVETRPDQIVAAAKDAGLDVVIEEVPVGPSNVGRFIGAQGATGDVTYLRVDGSNQYSPSYGFRVPVDFEGELRLRLGRAAGPGEEWASSSDATALGEVLACQQLVGRTLQDVLGLVQERGTGPVRVFIEDGGSREIFNAELPQHLTATVDRVTTTSDAGDVMIQAYDDPARPKPEGAPEMKLDPGC